MKNEAKEYRLEEWCMIWADDPFAAPEELKKAFVGKVYRHPEFKDGEEVKTAPLVRSESNRMTVEDGCVYVLGEIKQDYLRWMTEQGLAYDPENPIAMKRAHEMNMERGVPQE